MSRGKGYSLQRVTTGYNTNAVSDCLWRGRRWRQHREGEISRGRTGKVNQGNKPGLEVVDRRHSIIKSWLSKKVPCHSQCVRPHMAAAIASSSLPGHVLTCHGLFLSNGSQYVHSHLVRPDVFNPWLSENIVDSYSSAYAVILLTCMSSIKAHKTLQSKKDLCENSLLYRLCTTVSDFCLIHWYFKIIRFEFRFLFICRKKHLMLWITAHHTQLPG